MDLKRLAKDLEEIKGCIEDNHIEKAEDLLGFVIGEINIAAQQSVEPTKAIRCACGGEMLANYRCQNCGLASPL